MGKSGKKSEIARHNVRGKISTGVKAAVMMVTVTLTGVCMAVNTGITTPYIVSGHETDSAMAEDNSSYAKDDSISFEYNGRNVVISTDKPVELISMDELQSQIIEDNSKDNPVIEVPVASEEDIQAMKDKNKADYTYEDGQYIPQKNYNEPSGSVEGSIMGIDVSHWDEDINWNEVANAGYDFAIIKVCGRSIYDDGGLYEDAYFRSNIEGASAAGLKVGVYCFSQAVTVEEAYEEASYILNLIDGYNITYPVAFDWETADGYRTCDRLSREELTQICEAFCDTVRSHGYSPMIYMSKNDWTNIVYVDRLAAKYNVWLAWYFYKYYNVDDNYRYERDYYEKGDELPDLDFTYNIWQYTSTAHIPGVGTACDMNVSFGITHGPDSVGFGDVNGDGVISSSDVVMLKKYLAGIHVDNINLEKCDVNHDGKVDSKDAVKLLKKLAGYNVNLDA